ncbi:MAG TPA: iron-containing redox enzyme family protein [Polyangiales bacterium]|nr:iron-containing redox enzyme family protein [Polyangiales bacterium]
MQGYPRFDADDLHRSLARLNRMRMTPEADADRWLAALDTETSLRLLEHAFVEREREQVRSWARTAPTQPDAFVTWFEALAERGPGQGDALFPWLAAHATLEPMCWFLKQEQAGEAGFDDLVALTQLKLPTRAKLELARNYWDEMGQGAQSGMHGPMLEQLGVALELDARREATVWESLALANMMVALAANRHYAYQSVGALGVIELTAPGRAAQVNAGLKRLGLPGDARRYYALHATLDIKHSRAWNREVLQPLVAAEPRAASLIAEGALLRLRAGARCFERYRAVLWGGVPAEPTQLDTWPS